MAKNKVDKHCFECNSYQERTAGEGYCSEWDTIVDLTDLCIEEKEAQYLLQFIEEQKERIYCETR